MMAIAGTDSENALLKKNEQSSRSPGPYKILTKESLVVLMNIVIAIRHISGMKTK
jgi:hypothetical protein